MKYKLLLTISILTILTGHTTALDIKSDKGLQVYSEGEKRLDLKNNGNLQLGQQNSINLNGGNITGVPWIKTYSEDNPNSNYGGLGVEKQIKIQPPKESDNNTHINFRSPNHWVDDDKWRTWQISHRGDNDIQERPKGSLSFLFNNQTWNEYMRFDPVNESINFYNWTANFNSEINSKKVLDLHNNTAGEHMRLRKEDYDGYYGFKSDAADGDGLRFFHWNRTTTNTNNLLRFTPEKDISFEGSDVRDIRDLEVRGSLYTGGDDKSENKYRTITNTRANNPQLGLWQDPEDPASRYTIINGDDGIFFTTDFGNDSSMFVGGNHVGLALGTKENSDQPVTPSAPVDIGGNVNLNKNEINNVSTLNAETKNFVQDINGTHEAVYTSQESVDARAVVEGSVVVDGGLERVDLPRHFEQVVSDSEPSLNVQVTPRELASVAVTERSADEITVESTEDVKVDYRVTGVREGFEDKKVVRKK